MTTEDVIQRVAQIDACDHKNKQAIVDRYLHYKKATDEELLESSILIQGMFMGSEATRKALDNLKDSWLDKHNALVVLTKFVRDMREAQTAFHMSKKGSAAWNRMLKEATMLEGEIDKMLKGRYGKQSDLFT